MLAATVYNSFSYICRNGEPVEGTDHKRVVELIRQGKDTLNLVIISVTPSEQRKLDGPVDAVGNSETYDFTDRRGIPLTIPDTRTEEAHGQKYVVRPPNCFIKISFVFCQGQLILKFMSHSVLTLLIPEDTFR